MTNLARYSGQPDQSVWGLNNLAVANIAGGGVSTPTGTVYRVITTGSTGGDLRQYLSQAGIPEYQPNTVYTLNLWVKQETLATPLVVTLTNNSSTLVGLFTVFGSNLGVSQQGTVNPWSLMSSGVIPLSDGWYHLWMQGTTGGTATGSLDIAILNETVQSPGVSYQFAGVALYPAAELDYAATTTQPQGNLFLPVFDFPYHTVETRYPQQGATIQFGAGYTFASKPKGPPQRSFVLEFDGMQWQTLDDGSVDQYLMANNNPLALNTFYQQVGTWANFTYNHPYFGNIVVKFGKPLQIPRILPGNGVIKGLQVELIEQPI